MHACTHTHTHTDFIKSEPWGAEEIADVCMGNERSEVEKLMPHHRGEG